MKPNPVTRTIVENARRIIADEGDKVVERLAPLVSLAQDGFEFAVEILRQAVVKPGKVRADLLGKMANASAVSPKMRIDDPHSDFAGEVKETIYLHEETADEPEIVLPPYMTAHEAIKRARNDELELIKLTPVEVEEDVFRGMEYARVQRAESEPFSILDLVRREMADRMGALLIEEFSSPSRTGIEIPPPPTSERYDEMLVNVVGFKPEVLKEWQSWPFWKGVLAYQFAGILTKVWRIRNARDPIAQLEAAVEAKGKWYEALSMFDIDDADIEKAILRLYGDRGFDELRATAELRRFVKPNDESLMTNPHSAALLARGIIKLHDIDPILGEDRFMSVLPPYAYPMTVESALAMLGAENTRVDVFMRRRAQSILNWHRYPSDEQVESLASLIGGSASQFKDLEGFCRRMLGVGAEDLKQKLSTLSEEGFPVEPLAKDIMEIFPHEKGFEGIVRDTKAGDAEADEDEAALEAAAKSADAAAAQSATSAQLEIGLSALGASIKPKV
jgi:hypothetical protein